MQICTLCGGPIKPLFTSYYCVAECDKISNKYPPTLELMWRGILFEALFIEEGAQIPAKALIKEGYLFGIFWSRGVDYSLLEHQSIYGGINPGWWLLSTMEGHTEELPLLIMRRKK